MLTNYFDWGWFQFLTVMRSKAEVEGSDGLVAIVIDLGSARWFVTGNYTFVQTHLQSVNLPDLDLLGRQRLIGLRRWLVEVVFKVHTGLFNRGR